VACDGQFAQDREKDTSGLSLGNYFSGELSFIDTFLAILDTRDSVETPLTRGFTHHRSGL
jgi:hypothetical protein